MPPSLKPPARPVAGRPPGPPSPATAPPWGVLEVFLLAQSFIPGLLFIPGASFLRLATRVGVFVISLAVWAWIARSGRNDPASKSFPATPWLVACSTWLAVSLSHPYINSLGSGAAQVAMYVTALSPVFWAPAALASSRQIPRLMMIVFACNALSALLGVAQVYRPDTFNPPVIFAFESAGLAKDILTYRTPDGRLVTRPCGLTDNPGAAAGAGMIACLIGLSLAVRPVAAWKRLIGLGSAFVGLAAIYFCQIRTALVMEAICIVILIALLLARRRIRQATMLAVGSVALVFAAGIYAVAVVGQTATARFLTLLADRPDKVYAQNRGGFLWEAFDRLIWEYPLGAGLGKWGQGFAYFGDHTQGYGSPYGPIWAEVQWPAWILDGGIPLMVAYATAIALALADSVRIALRARDEELAYWAAIICTLNFSIAATCFSACPFVAPVGITFWLMASLLHAADGRTRRGDRRAAPPRSAASAGRRTGLR